MGAVRLFPGLLAGLLLLHMERSQDHWKGQSNTSSSHEAQRASALYTSMYVMHA